RRLDLIGNEVISRQNSPSFGQAADHPIRQDARGIDGKGKRHECPASEVRDPSRHPLTRTSEAKGALQVYDLVPLFDEVPKRACRRWDRKFKSAAPGHILILAGDLTAACLDGKRGAAYEQTYPVVI